MEKKNDKFNNIMMLFILALLSLCLMGISAMYLIKLKEKDRIIDNLQSQIVSLQEENRDVMELYTKEVLEKNEEGNKTQD